MAGIEKPTHVQRGTTNLVSELAETESVKGVHRAIYELDEGTSEDAFQQRDQVATNLLSYRLPEIPQTTTILCDGIEQHQLSFATSEIQKSKNPENYYTALPQQIGSSAALERQDILVVDESGSSNFHVATDEFTSVFRFGSRRVTATPSTYRIRISLADLKADDMPEGEGILARLNSWEWSSVPSLDLWDPLSGNKKSSKTNPNRST